MFLKVTMHPLGDFIDKQIRRLEISDTAFSKRVGVDKSTLSLWMSEHPPAEPSFRLLAGLARATGVDICAIIALVDPELTRANPQVGIAAGMIADLTTDELNELDTHLLALKLKRPNKFK